MREKIAAAVFESLQEHGFRVQSFLGTHSCFDFVGRKNSEIVLVKVLENIDGLREIQAIELAKLSQLFNALALVVGEKSKSAKLEDGISYERYGIACLSLETFRQVLEKNLPFSKSFKGQNIAELDAKKLKAEREKRKLSLSELAEKVNLSPETLYRYEHGQGASLEKARAIEQALDVSLVKPVSLRAEPLEAGKGEEKKVEDRVLKQLRLLGIPFTSFAHAPFKAYSLPSESLLIEEAAQSAELPHKAESLQKSAKAFQSHAVIFARESRKEKVGETPIVLESELHELKKGKALMKLVKKREKA
ncbi:MAG: helix-turn-helix domain-containing protein [Candidatus Diapherotrites archaeon]